MSKCNGKPSGTTSHVVSSCTLCARKTDGNMKLSGGAFYLFNFLEGGGVEDLVSTRFFPHFTDKKDRSFPVEKRCMILQT